MSLVSGCNGIVTNPFLSNRFRLCEGFGIEWARISFDRTARRMKHYLPAVLALACIVLVISLIVTKRGDNAQHETDAGALAGCSNQLMLAQAQIVGCNEMMLTLSNRLDESQSAS